MTSAAPPQGQIGEDAWFSEIYVRAARGGMTGGVLVQSARGDAAVFFRDGRPVHAAGAGFTTHHLGGVLVEMGACTQDALEAAVAKQAESPNPPLLGALLVADAGVSPADVKRAVQQQNEARFAQLFSWSEGSFTSAPGENARIRDVGVVTAAWPLFFRGLQENAADAELRALADRLLGKAIQLKGGALGLADYEPTKLEKKLLGYLEKPRKPDQLERALKKRRPVRGFVRALELLDRLTVLPAGKGIAIPKASLVSMDLPGAEHFKAAATGRRGNGGQSVETAQAPRADSTPPLPPKKKHPIIAEVEKLHAALGEKNHFELLGATEKTEPAELRRLFTTLAKKYHPDAFPTEVEEKVATKAREISAALNEAYQTLTNEERRAEYVRLLADDRIKGDVRKAERIREAEMNAKKGAVVLRKRDYKQARDFYRLAMELDPDTPDHKARYAWAVFADPTQDRKKALEEALPLVQAALTAKKEDPTLHYYMAQLEKARGNEKVATKHFRVVLKLDRNHADARRELRLLEMRDSKKSSDKKGSLPFSRFFRKDD